MPFEETPSLTLPRRTGRGDRAAPYLTYGPPLPAGRICSYDGRMAFLDVLMRWVHVMSAVLAIGGAFFLRVLLPKGLALIDEPRREEVLLRCRRAFKMVVHPAILGLLVSGVYNTVRNWPKYSLNRPLLHGLWGPHLLLGLAVIAISLWLLAGKSLRPNHRRWMGINLALMLTTVLVASALKQARDGTIWSLVPDDAKAGRAAPLATPATAPATAPAVLP
jgi:hypothetical protein